jgi:hypothetical protein
MGDDAQETEVAEYAQYIEDPPSDLVIAEDEDNDAMQAVEWAARHPRATSNAASPDDRPAEESAVHETRQR